MVNRSHIEEDFRLDTTPLLSHKMKVDSSRAFGYYFNQILSLSTSYNNNDNKGL